MILSEWRPLSRVFHRSIDLQLGGTPSEQENCYTTLTGKLLLPLFIISLCMCSYMQICIPCVGSTEIRTADGHEVFLHLRIFVEPIHPLST